MENAVGREIPDEILQRYGKEGYKGAYARDGVRYRKTAPRVKQAGAFHPGSIIKMRYPGRHGAVISSSFS